MTHPVLGRTQGGWNSYVIEKLAPALLMKTINHGFCCIDRRATSDGYDDVGSSSFECLQATDDALNRSMLPYLGEGRGKGTVIFQDSFNGGDHIRLDTLYVNAEGEVNANS